MQRAKSAEERRDASRRAAIGYGLSRYLVGREVADALGYPRSHWSVTLPVQVAALRAGLGAARRVNPLEAWLASVGERPVVTRAAITIQNAAKLRPQPNAGRFGGHCIFFAPCLAAASAMATMRWNNVHIRYSR